ncbi:hypothetical protein PybrP1_012387 [[Pythium] brassicae (nom. inval.)]|nr:hypothetical protein PybrP1_012387 [[Pythium] brassicae (nom. inval.)]
MSSGGGSGSSNYNSSGGPGKKKKKGVVGDATSSDARAIPVIRVASGDSEVSIDTNRHSPGGSPRQYPTSGMKCAPSSCSSTATSRSTAVVTPILAMTTPLEVGQRRSRTNGRKPYWRRRMEQFDQENESDAASLTSEGATVQPMESSLSVDQSAMQPRRPSSSASTLHEGCIASLPLSIQVGFRRKMFSVFALQLLVVTGLMVALTYDTGLNSLMESAFQHTSWYLLGTLAVMVVFLVLLYLGHAVFPINWVILAVFSVALSVFVSSVQVYLNTNAGLFCCGFTFLAVMIMIPLSGVERRVRRAEEGGDERVLLGTTMAGFVAYLAVTSGAVLLFAIFGDRFVFSRIAFLLSLVLEFALILWFSYDASTMYTIMSPDEYMSGVIFFYTDLLVVIVIVVIFGALALLFSSAGMGAGGFGGSCDCFGCFRVGRVFGGSDGGDGNGVAGSHGTDSDSMGRRESLSNAAVVPEEMVRS